MNQHNRSSTIVATALSIALLSQTASVAEEKEESKDSDHHYLHKTEKPHAAAWSYQGATGPQHWGDLSPAYALAKTGKQQSPIDIRRVVRKGLPELEFRYQPSRIRLIYNGHTIEENEAPGSFGISGGKRYELQQFHFHSPSEHTVDGEHFAMEMHLVHRADDGSIGVVAVFIEEGDHNRSFDPIWAMLPDSGQPTRNSNSKIDTLALLPSNHEYYAYDGSFTTPPCTEQVKWAVLTDPIQLSKQQITRFRRAIDGNNRPVQPLNGRQTFRSTSR